MDDTNDLKLNIACDVRINLHNVTTLPSTLAYLPQEWGIFCVVWPCLMAFGCLSNLSFIWTVWRTPALHTATYFYLVCIACADLTSLICLGFTNVRGYVNGQTTRVRHAYDFFDIATNIVFAFAWVSSTGFVALVSLERFLAICHPIKHRVVTGTTRTLRLICGTLVMSVACNCTTIPSYLTIQEILVCITWPADDKYIDYPQGAHALSMKSGITRVIPLFLYAMFWLAVVFSNCYMYTKILLALRTRRHNTQLSLSHRFENQMHQVAVMVITNGWIFFFLVPYKFLLTQSVYWSCLELF